MQYEQDQVSQTTGEVIEIVDYSANLRRITDVISPLEEIPYNGHATDMLNNFRRMIGADLYQPAMGTDSGDKATAVIFSGCADEYLSKNESS